MIAPKPLTAAEFALLKRWAEKADPRTPVSVSTLLRLLATPCPSGVSAPAANGGSE